MTSVSLFASIAKLRELQSVVQSNECLRSLLRGVAQDAQLETFDLVASRRTLMQAISKFNQPKELNDARIVLVGYLELVGLFLQIHVLRYPMDRDTRYVGGGPRGLEDDEMIIAMWLYENNTRLTKYVILGKFLEFLNLQSLGCAEPKPDDIPTWAIIIWEKLHFFRQAIKPYVTAQWNEKLRQVNIDFLNLCPEHAHAVCAKNTAIWFYETPKLNEEQNAAAISSSSSTSSPKRRAVQDDEPELF
jgi:hypothetical protein